MTDGIGKGKAEVTVIRLQCIALAILQQLSKHYYWLISLRHTFPALEWFTERSFSLSALTARFMVKRSWSPNILPALKGQNFQINFWQGGYGKNKAKDTYTPLLPASTPPVSKMYPVLMLTPKLSPNACYASGGQTGDPSQTGPLTNPKGCIYTRKGCTRILSLEIYILSNPKNLFRFYGFRSSCEIDISITKASTEILLRWL